MKCEIKIKGKGVVRKEQLLREIEEEDALMRGIFNPSALSLKFMLLIFE